MTTVGSSAAVPLGDGGYLLQNLGSGDLYLGDEDVTTSNGFKLSDGQIVAVGHRDNLLYGISSGTSDVRELDRGLGVFTDMTLANTSS